MFKFITELIFQILILFLCMCLFPKTNRMFSCSQDPTVTMFLFPRPNHCFYVCVFPRPNSCFHTCVCFKETFHACACTPDPTLAFMYMPVAKTEHWASCMCLFPRPNSCFMHVPVPETQPMPVPKTKHWFSCMCLFPRPNIGFHICACPQDTTVISCMCLFPRLRNCFMHVPVLRPRIVNCFHACVCSQDPILIFMHVSDPPKLQLF